MVNASEGSELMTVGCPTTIFIDRFTNVRWQNVAIFKFLEFESINIAYLSNCSVPMIMFSIQIKKTFFSGSCVFFDSLIKTCFYRGMVVWMIMWKVM